MLTIFTTFKPFTDSHIKTIQRNALQSWLLLRPRPEVIVFGNDQGVKEVAKEFGVLHVPKIETKQGLPLISSLFMQAQRIAKFPLLCYTNGDIIFMQDVISAINAIFTNAKQFLAVGRRYDYALTEALDFTGDWQKRLQQGVASKSALHGYSGIDYFIFPKGLYRDIPPLVVGRGGWDNWMIYSVRKQGIAVIDITQATTVVHQEHDAPYTRQYAARFSDELAQTNLGLAGGYGNLLTIRDASFLLTKNGLKRNLKGIASLTYPVRLLFSVKRYLQHVWKH